MLVIAGSALLGARGTSLEAQEAPAAENVVLIGGPGTGKTHAATALGVQAIEHHRRKVRFFCKRRLCPIELAYF